MQVSEYVLAPASPVCDASYAYTRHAPRTSHKHCVSRTTHAHSLLLSLLLRTPEGILELAEILALAPGACLDYFDAVYTKVSR